MTKVSQDAGFAGAISKLYETHLVPMLFESYAADIASRLTSDPPARLLEIAAGTGVVTRALAHTLPDSVSIVATDLNPDMIEQAYKVGTSRPVEWRQADVMKLPFGDATFDAVVCQFGVMFFPDKAKAYAEVHRVLKPDGVFMFNVWDEIEENDFARAVSDALKSFFPAKPPGFLARSPYGYHDAATIKRDLAGGGFTASPQFDTVSARGHAPSPRSVAVGFIQGTPLRTEVTW
jgi:SAM-dependent methyltransferase